MITETLHRLTGLRPQTYEHPSDEKALDAIQKAGGIDKLFQKCSEYGLERLLRVQFTGSYLRVTSDSFPILYQMVKDVCAILDVPKEPGLYIQPGGLNAFTAGTDKPIIVLNAGLIDSMSDQELFFVLGHEIGHIKSGHVLYHQVAMMLPIIADLIGKATFGIGALLSVGFQITLLRWQRMSELTADRAGLLACQDASAAMSAMVKLAGLPSKFFDSVNIADFIVQAREFESMDTDKLDMIAKFFSSMGQTHPWTVMRAHELLKWTESGDYDRIISRLLCFKCKKALCETAIFCATCGFKMR